MDTTNLNSKAQPAEISDDADIAVGANYGVTDPCAPLNPKPGFRYFAAANDGDTSRPDGVERVKQMGYEVCVEEKCLSTDCVLMRIPLEKWEARQRRIREATSHERKTAGNPAAIPGESRVSIDRDSDTMAEINSAYAKGKKK